MKKLVMIVAVALAAVGLQAASVTWSISGEKAMVGYTAYAVLGATVADSWDSIDALKESALDGTGTFSGSRSVSAIGTSAGAALTKDNANIYFVIVNSDQSEWAVTDVKDLGELVYDPANQESASGTASFSASGLSYKSFGGTPGPGPTPGDTPEPTSGLLLLVGGAALALRRKQK